MPSRADALILSRERVTSLRVDESYRAARPSAPRYAHPRLRPEPHARSSAHPCCGLAFDWEGYQLHAFETAYDEFRSNTANWALLALCARPDAHANARR